MQANPLSTELTGALNFSIAATAWFEDHKRYIKPSTADSYGDALKRLTIFFGDKPINEIGILHLRMYQGLRSAKVCANTVNRELGVLQQVLREFDEWKRFEKHYRQLKEAPPRRAGCSLTREEEDRLRDVAFSKPKWRLAGHCMIVMLSTAMGFGELRHVRRGDVNMKGKCVIVRDAKNAYRVRTFPLNSAACESMTWILKRWKKLGGCDPKHYILPRRARRERISNGQKKIPWILDEPTTAMYSAFRSIRNAAGLPQMRIYDCRVQAITKLLSSPLVSPQASREIAGHISQAMQNRYSIQTFSTKKAALDTLDAPPPTPSTSEAALAGNGGRIIAFPGKMARA